MRDGMDYSQFKELVKSCEQLNKDYHSFISDFLGQEGMKVVAHTKRLTPVDTGALRNRWKMSGPFKRGDSRYIVIHNNLEYASFVEDGHKVVNNSGNVRVKVGRGKKMKVKTLHLGDMAKGEKWIKGHHMARIALTRAENNLEAHFNTAFKKFCKDRGLG